MALNNFKCYHLMPLHFKGLSSQSTAEEISVSFQTVNSAKLLRLASFIYDDCANFVMQSHMTWTAAHISTSVLSRVDYCNSSFAEQSAVALVPLYSELNAATLYVADVRLRDHVRSVSPALSTLASDPSMQTPRAPCAVNWSPADYVSRVATLTSATFGRSHLRSAGSLTFDIPRTRTRMGDRALSHGTRFRYRHPSLSQSGHLPDSKLILFNCS